MSQSTGPQLLFPLEQVTACIADSKTFSLANIFSTEEDEYERGWQLRAFFTPLLHAVRLSTGHFEALDAHFTTLIPRAISSYPSETPESDNAQAVQETMSILQRLPSLPQRLFSLPLMNTGLRFGRDTLWDGIKQGRWATKYVLPAARHRFNEPSQGDAESILTLISKLQDVAWENLYVTTFIDTNSVVLAIKIAQYEGQRNLTFAKEFLDYINLLTELITEYERLNDVADLADLSMFELFSDTRPSVQALKAALIPGVDGDHEQSRAILRVFLWTAWQRSIMLYFYYILDVQLRQGYSSAWDAFLAVPGIDRLSELNVEIYRGSETKYMCQRAFEILRTSRSSLGLDFRTMISRFGAHFGDRSGRCIKGSIDSCDVDKPESCQRFTDAETKSQSAHASNCDENTCLRILWSEESYREIEGPRAVSLKQSSIALARGDRRLQYCKASSRTVAFSHVWSHGQGGRPEEGINNCLHQRYTALAKVFGGDSYWIDSACIPSDRQLRKEAIGTINDVFVTSNTILVSDCDLQSVDLSVQSIETLETLLSILLVCDWNVRAWTMLEAIRSQKNVHILCKGDHTIPVRELCRKVLNEGAIDIAILLGSAQHLLPSSNTEASLSAEHGGFLLSQRHASHPNDEVLIWALLNNLVGDRIVSNLWESQTVVRTGFLMSSAPRVECVANYGWAPREPYIRPQTRTVSLSTHTDSVEMKQNYVVCYHSYDGQGSYLADVTSQGLKGKWLVWHINIDELSEYRENFCHKTSLGEGHPTQMGLNPQLEPDIEVYEQPDTANACDVLEGLRSQNYQTVVIRPVAEGGTVPYEGGNRRGEIYGMNAAICTRVSDDKPWQWKGVYQWLEDNQHSSWNIEYMEVV